MLKHSLMEIYTLLHTHFGPQSWWPGQSRFEIIIGAILTQNTNWQNVEKAITNLKQADLLSPEKLSSLEITELAETIRPAGYYNVKAKRLTNFLIWLNEECAGNLDALEKINPYVLRESLLGINGIGKETADSIILYGFEKPVFVVDTYTFRILFRHGIIDQDADYDMIQDLFHTSLENDVKLFNEFHALLVCAGKHFCKPKAKCKGCPLEVLPHTIEESF